MNRRQLLGAVGGFGVPLSGCTGLTGSPTPPQDVEVPPCPEKPDPLTRETVGRFATRFERAYVARLTLRRASRYNRTITSSSLGVGVDDPEVTATENGWVVRFPVTGPAYSFRTRFGETGHVEPGFRYAHYFVTDDTVVRATRGAPRRPVDPREYGTAVQCPPSSDADTTNWSDTLH